MRCAPAFSSEISLPKDAVAAARPFIVRAHRPPGHRRRAPDARRRHDRDSHERAGARTRSSTLRSYLFDAVYENQVATAEFGKAAGILGGLWEKVRQRPEEFLDLRTVEAEGVDVAAQDFLAGMTDRYAVRLFEQLFIPKALGRDRQPTRLTRCTDPRAYNIVMAPRSSACITSPRPWTMRRPTWISASSCSACGW